MSDPRDAPAPAAAEPGTGEPGVTEQPAEKPRPGERPTGELAPPFRGTAIALAGALLLVVALVATAPFWAPLLPWGAGASRDDAALVARIDQMSAALQQGQQETASANAMLARLDRRIGTLEAKPAVSQGDIAELREQVAKLAAASADREARIAAIDKNLHAQAAQGATDAGVALTLLQIRDAVSAGRPFAAEYQALVSLARSQPELTAAIAPLAEPARTGVASRAVLIQRLHELKVTMAAAKPPPAAAGWADAALSRLSGLVTIRRIDGAVSEGSPAAAVDAAELALAGGDLAGTVGALDKLTGAPAEAARPWLRMARQRLAVDSALQTVEARLTARLGGAPGTPDSAR